MSSAVAHGGTRHTVSRRSLSAQSTHAASPGGYVLHYDTVVKTWVNMFMTVCENCVAFFSDSSCAGSESRSRIQAMFVTDYFISTDFESSFPLFAIQEHESGLLSLFRVAEGRPLKEWSDFLADVCPRARRRSLQQLLAAPHYKQVPCNIRTILGCQFTLANKTKKGAPTRGAPRLVSPRKADTGVRRRSCADPQRVHSAPARTGSCPKVPTPSNRRGSTPVATDYSGPSATTGRRSQSRDLYGRASRSSSAKPRLSGGSTAGLTGPAGSASMREPTESKSRPSDRMAFTKASGAARGGLRILSPNEFNRMQSTFKRTFSGPSKNANLDAGKPRSGNVSPADTGLNPGRRARTQSTGSEQRQKPGHAAQGGQARTCKPVKLRQPISTTLLRRHNEIMSEKTKGDRRRGKSSEAVPGTYLQPVDIAALRQDLTQLTDRNLALEVQNAELEAKVLRLENLLAQALAANSVHNSANSSMPQIDATRSRSESAERAEEMFDLVSAAVQRSWEGQLEDVLQRFTLRERALQNRLDRLSSNVRRLQINQQITARGDVENPDGQVPVSPLSSSGPAPSLDGDFHALL